LTAVRNSGLKVSLDVEGNSLRRARSMLMPLAPTICLGLADVYATMNPRKKTQSAGERVRY
jgi:hypothetical protein